MDQSHVETSPPAVVGGARLSPGRSLLRLLPGRERRLKSGHPWAFSNEIDMKPAYRALPAGGVVRLEGDDGTKFGSFCFNPHSLIAARKLSRDPEAPLDRAWLSARLDKALALRARLGLGAHCRLIHAESDGMPGLIADRYGDVAVIQANSAWADGILPDLVELLVEKLGLRGIVGRNDSPSRSLEGLDSSVSLLFGEASGVLAIEGGVAFPIDPLGGQKTGYFFDQRLHRDMAAKLSAGFLAPGGRVLDVCCHVGAFGLRAAAAGATHVTLIDSSEPALLHARAAAERNGLSDRVTTQRRDAFEALEQLGASGQKFEMVICDPPAFAKSRKDVEQGLRAYARLARLAAGVVTPGGLLFMASCSHHAAPDVFAERVALGVWKAGRDGRIFASGGAGPDHPVHPGLPESSYLKGLWLQLD